MIFALTKAHMARRSFTKSGKGGLFGSELPSLRAELPLGVRSGGHGRLKGLRLQARGYYGVILGVEARVADRDPKLAFLILSNQEWCDCLFRHRRSLMLRKKDLSARHDPTENAHKHACEASRDGQAADARASAANC